MPPAWRGGLVLVAAVLLLAGCGGDKSDDGTVASPPHGATTTTPATSPPSSRTSPRSRGPGGAGSATGSARGEDPVRVPVTLVFRGDGRVDPPAVTVPAFIAVEVTLRSRDGRAHTLRLRERGRSYQLAVGPGGRQTTRLPGLRAGSYRLEPVGGGRGATLTVGGEAGP
jgi:hypothetical protein